MSFDQSHTASWWAPEPMHSLTASHQRVVSMAPGGDNMGMDGRLLSLYRVLGSNQPRYMADVEGP